MGARILTVVSRNKVQTFPLVTTLFEHFLIIKALWHAHCGQFVSKNDMKRV